MLNKRHLHIWLLPILLLGLTLLIGLEIKLLVNTDKHKQESVNKTISIIRTKELQFLRISNNFFSDTLNATESFLKIKNLAAANAINLNIFKLDTLRYWNNNLLNTQRYLKIIQPGTRFLLANNGYYLTHQSKFGNWVLVQYYLIKTNYQYQNQYIVNHFNSELNFLEGAIPSPSPVNDFVNITDSKGNFLFAIQVYEKNRLTPLWLKLFIFAFIIAILYCFKKLIKQLLQYNTWLASITYFVLMLGTKYLFLKLKIPVFIYNLELFSPVHYATSAFIPSLGDFFILVAILLWYFIILGNKISVSKLSKSQAAATLFFVSLFTATLTDSALDGLKSLVNDSQLTFDLTNIQSLNYITFFALMLGICLLFSVYLITKRFYLVYTNINLSSIKKVIITAFAFYFVHPYIVINLFERNSYYPIVNTAVILLFLIYTHWVLQKTNRLQQYLILSLIFSVLASVFIQYWSSIREQENRKLFADKLISQNDINTEIYLNQIENRIANDNELKNYFTNSLILQKQLQRRLSQLYFTGHLSKYDITLYDYDSALNHYSDRNLFTYRQINYAYNELSDKTIATNFRLLKNTAYIKGYLGKFVIKQAGKVLGYLFIQLQPKLLIDENRFDELLMEGFKVSSTQKHQDYSYAIYRDFRLISQSGMYNYHLSYVWPKLDQNQYFINDYGYNHLIVKDDKSSIVVVSKKSNALFEPFGLFSLYFTFFTVVLLVSLLLNYIIQSSLMVQIFNKYFSNWHSVLISINKLLLVNRKEVALLRSKIQIAVVFIVFSTLSITAVFTINLISESYMQKQTDKLVQKLRGVVSAIETDIILDANTDKIEADAYLNQIGEYYNTDITFFNTSGQVVSSTISKIYDNGIIAPVIDAEAYYRLNNLQESRYVNNERIATFDFIGAYLPVVNKKKIIVGYVMLPYFNKQADLYAELASIIIGFINLYAFLFIIIGILAWLVSRNITFPLALIEKQLANISLNKRNEPINWQKDDEIGRLVQQYNKMIDQLQHSAEILAQSERESAWRDIARQIAHEIKNPLTPMKLSVQHLERAWNDNSPKLPDTFKRVTKTLITQINTLSELAGEFSNFAKMPQPKPTAIDLIALVQTQINAYEQIIEKGSINFVKPAENVTLYFDEGFLNRTLTNLIKNAIQAVPEDESVNIEIGIKADNDNVLIWVKDNGTGIDSEKSDRIFTPYFSTKSFGMGLGLPIVKSMIESSGGKIWFKNNTDKGTTFFVQIPFNHEP